MWKKKYEVLEIKADSQPDVAVYTIKYSNNDGREEIKTERISEIDLIDRIALDSIHELNRKDKITKIIANPVLGEVDLTPKPLTPDEIKAQEIAKKKQELNQAATDLKLGVITQQEYDTILAEYKALIAS